MTSSHRWHEGGSTCPVCASALPEEIAEDSVDSFIEAVAHISTARRDRHGGGPASGPKLVVGDVLASRYRLQEELGRGAHGEVWSAHDSIAHEAVAVKILLGSAARHAARVRTEIASLRRLRLPGVVRLLDEGVEGGAAFLVMPLVAGAPFPGRPGPLPWAEIEGAAENLLETLARVHAAGIVHRDLKPANVLVDAGGRPTLLDFGLSFLRAFEESEEAGQIVGTPAYLAPEQCTGKPVDPRADLYAVGVMLYLALSGTLPHEARDVRTLMALKPLPPPALSIVAPLVPERIAREIDRLLAVHPADRPSSAADALARLRGARDRPPRAPLGLPEPVGSAGYAASELRALFGGSDRLDWAAADAARILHARTHGDPARVRELVEEWLRAGRCRWERGPRPLLSMRRDAVDELESDLWSAPASRDASFVENTLMLARRLAEGGRLQNATAAVHDATSALRRAPAQRAEALGRALSLWVEIALADGAPQALDRVLYEICRSGADPAVERQLEALVRAALAVGAWSHRASDLAEELPPFASPGLETRRLQVRVLAARRSSLEREATVVLDAVEIAERSSDARLRASAAGWLGKLRYREGRYEEAEALQLRAAHRSCWRTERIAATLHAASASLEAFRIEAARDLATQALESATACRSSYLAGRAEWLIRSASYRLGEDHRVDEELLAAARTQGAPEIFGMIALVESAHAYRAQDPRARALATEAYEWWASGGEPIASLLAGALAVASSASRDAPPPASSEPGEGSLPPTSRGLGRDGRERLRAAAWSCRVPGIGIQTAALLHEGGVEAPPAALIDELAATVARQRWSHRMDVLSVEESIAMLRGQATRQTSA